MTLNYGRIIEEEKKHKHYNTDVVISKYSALNKRNKIANRMLMNTGITKI